MCVCETLVLGDSLTLQNHTYAQTLEKKHFNKNLRKKIGFLRSKRTNHFKNQIETKLLYYCQKLHLYSFNYISV